MADDPLDTAVPVPATLEGAEFNGLVSTWPDRGTAAGLLTAVRLLDLERDVQAPAAGEG